MTAGVIMSKKKKNKTDPNIDDSSESPDNNNDDNPTTAEPDNQNRYPVPYNLYQSGTSSSVLDHSSLQEPYLHQSMNDVCNYHG